MPAFQGNLFSSGNYQELTVLCTFSSLTLKSQKSDWINAWVNHTRFGTKLTNLICRRFFCFFVVVCVDCRIEQCIDIIRFLRNRVGVSDERLWSPRLNSPWTSTKSIIKKAVRLEGTLLNTLWHLQKGAWISLCRWHLWWVYCEQYLMDRLPWSRLWWWKTTRQQSPRRKTF